MLQDLDPLMEQAGVDAIVAEGNAFEVPDIFWLTGFRSPDSVIYFKNRGETGVVAAYFHTLERIKRESHIEQTLDMTELYTDLISDDKRPYYHPEVVYRKVLGDLFHGDVIGIPDHLPARVVLAIQALGYNIKILPDLIKDARGTKSDEEIKTIKRAGDATVDAIKKVIDLINDTEIGPNKKLLYEQRPLTVRQVKLALEHALLGHGAESAEDAITAVGKKGFDWHYLGKPDDVLKAGVPIILDVFPRLKLDRYVADVTRTIVKGAVDEKLQHMFDAVKRAADACVDKMSDGVLIDDMNMACFESLQKDGYKSRRLDPQTEEGMTHGLGHGIGLEVHENPSMYNKTARFEAGNVMAIEPGVYLKSIGGVRIENDYAVTKGKAKRLTTGLDDFVFL